MKIKTGKGQILESNNPLIIGQWRRTGLTEVAEEKTERRASKKQTTVKDE